jgi:integrase
MGAYGIAGFSVAKCIPPVHTLSAAKHYGMKQTAQFTKSKVPCLVRHKAGNYYASAKVAGKVVRRSLDTDDFNTAKNRLAEALAGMRGATNSAQAGTLGQALAAEAARANPDIKPTSISYYRECAQALAKFAATLPVSPLGVQIGKVKIGELRAFMDAYRATASPTRYNGTLALLRRTYERAIEAGHAGVNTAKALVRARVTSRKFTLPTADDFAVVVAEILAQGRKYSKSSAASVEFLAYTGLRISEARSVKWGDVEEKALVVRTAKNDMLRRVPLIPAARALLSRLKASGLPVGADDPVMPLKTPRIALDNACARLGIAHLRVHDLRHIFATRCIEAGVDLSTLAGWLGHKDGGVLCAQVYGHLCEKHSASMADKVRA